MIKKNILHLIIYTSIAVISTNNITHAKNNIGFFDRKAEGWFWYNEEEEIEPEIKPEIKPEIEPEIKETPSKPAITTSAPAYFSSEWFRVNLPKYKDLAWDNPTNENVQAYLLLQRMAIDRSEKFSNVVEAVTLGNPKLDENARRPTATFASQQVDKDAAKARNKVLTSLSEKVGIFFFFKSDCDVCELQAPVVKMIEKQFGFYVQAISADGKALKNNDYPNFKIDNGHADILEVATYPALFLADETGHFSAISQGAVSFPDLVQRILIASVRENWITEEELNSTKAINVLPTQDTNFDIESLEGDENNFVSPEVLLNYIN